MLVRGEPLTPEILARFEEVINEPKNPIKYLSIDPGKKSGICGYDAKYHLLFMYTAGSDDIVQLLSRIHNIAVCVVEDYRLYPNKAKKQNYSDMETSRVIGRFEFWAETQRVKLVKQGAHVKSTGYAWAGEKPLPKSNPRNHELDAHIHFIYWAVKSGRMDATALLQSKPCTP